LEVLLVLLIISIACAVAAPGIDAVLAKAEADAALRELVTDIRYAQQLSIARGRVYRINFNVNLQLYWMSYAQHPAPAIVKQVYFPEALTLIGTNFDHHTLGFNAMGAPLAAGTLEFKDKKGRTIRVTVLPATGRVRVYR